MPNSILVFNGLFTEKNCSKTSRFSHSIPGLFKDNDPIIDLLVINITETTKTISSSSPYDSIDIMPEVKVVSSSPAYDSIDIMPVTKTINSSAAYDSIDIAPEVNDTSYSVVPKTYAALIELTN